MARAAHPAASMDREATTPAMDTRGAVRQVITTFLPGGCPGIEVVAEAIHLGPRTLQRRLDAEGLTFAGLVAMARFAEARRMLASRLAR